MNSPGPFFFRPRVRYRAFRASAQRAASSSRCRCRWQVKLGFAYLDGGAGGLFLKGAGLGLPVSYVLFLSLMTSLEKMDLQLDYRCMWYVYLLCRHWCLTFEHLTNDACSTLHFSSASKKLGQVHRHLLQTRIYKPYQQHPAAMSMI